MCSWYVLKMAANASHRAQRYAVLESLVGSFGNSHYFEIDCGSPACRRDRMYALAGLTLYRPLQVAEFLKRLRCDECSKPVIAAALVHTIGVRRPVTQRLWLLGSEAKD